jgi:hypothetical protein
MHNDLSSITVGISLIQKVTLVKQAKKKNNVLTGVSSSMFLFVAFTIVILSLDIQTTFLCSLFARVLVPRVSLSSFLMCMVAWLLVMHLRNWGKMKNLHQFQIPYTGNEKK